MRTPTFQKPTKLAHALALTTILVSAAFVGCSSESAGGEEDDAGDTDTDNGIGNGNGNGGSSIYCCINGAFYGCPSKAALDQCIGFDIDGCMMACAFDDFECQDQCFAQWSSSSPDPSACTRDAGSDATCNGGSGTGTGNGTGTGTGNGNCSGALSGCDYDSDCCSGNCTNNQCEGNGLGSPCDYDSDCDSGNCTNGTCESNGFGSPCDYDSDCSSGNCFEGECQ